MDWGFGGLGQVFWCRCYRHHECFVVLQGSCVVGRMRWRMDMTLEEAKKWLDEAQTEEDRRDRAKVVAIKEARVARDGGDGQGERIAASRVVPGGDNPYDINGW
jgi:hypothetical protein